MSNTNKQTFTVELSNGPDNSQLESMETIAQDYILRAANSTNPRQVLSQHFEKVYQLAFVAGRSQGMGVGLQIGRQQGLTESGAALDIAAAGGA